MTGPYGRGALGALVMALSLGTAVAVGEIADARYGIGDLPGQLLVAVLCSGIAVPLVVWIRRRLDGLPLRGLGFPECRRGLATFALGALVTGGAALVTFGLGAAMGWIVFGEASVPLLARFLAVNTPVAFLYEALPEELTLRGYAYRSLSAGLRRWTAAVSTTALFLLVPATSSVFQAGVTRILGGIVQPPRIAPGGEDPVAYLILLTFFGTTLVVARVTTGSLWASIGVHLTFLTVNRAVLDATNGLPASFATPNAILLIPAYLLLATVGFLALARWQGNRVGWRDRDPEAPIPVSAVC